MNAKALFVLGLMLTVLLCVGIFVPHRGPMSCLANVATDPPTPAPPPCTADYYDPSPIAFFAEHIDFYVGLAGPPLIVASAAVALARARKRRQPA